MQEWRRHCRLPWAVKAHVRQAVAISPIAIGFMRRGVRRGSLMGISCCD
jgi:hypothetical protein